MRVPGVRVAMSSSMRKVSWRVGVLDHAVDDDVVLGEEPGQRTRRLSTTRLLRGGGVRA